MTIFEPRTRGISRKRREFSKRGLVLPLALFCVILAFYGVTTAAILTTEGPACGFLVVMLFVIGHDACHQSFTSSRPLNELIGRIAFLPSLHVFSLWECEHNRRLERMQHSVERSGAVEWDFSLPEYFKVCARCKLFDYEQGRWTDYESKTTSEPLLGLVPPTLRHS
jgi:hypothetical protein